MKPTAAPHRWPYREHRTLAEVDHDEFMRLPDKERRGKKLRDFAARGAA